MAFFLKFFDATIAFILRFIIRYRLDVIRQNMSACFHYSSPRELNSDIWRYYLHIAKIIRQVLATPTRRLLHERMHLEPTPELTKWLQEGKSVIINFGHLGNWEWTGSFIGCIYPDQVCAFYKKIKTTWVNNLMYRRRLSHVNYLIESNQLGAMIKLIHKKPMLILMISDQNPGLDSGIIWAPFFNRHTAFVNGPENLALRYHLPMVYVHNDPGADGGYNLRLEQVYDGSEMVAPGEITSRYAGFLEKNIIAQRTHWLWSHKRWKRSDPSKA